MAAGPGLSEDGYPNNRRRTNPLSWPRQQRKHIHFLFKRSRDALVPAQSNLKSIGIFAGGFFRHANMQSVSPLLVLKCAVVTEQRHRINFRRTGLSSSEGLYNRFAVRRPCQFNCIQRIAFLGEPKIVLSKRSCFGIVKCASNNIGRALSVRRPWPCSIDGLAVDLEP